MPMARFGCKKSGLVLAAALAAVCWAPAKVLAAKTDIVVLANGDRITGEFKKIQRGQLHWSTDSMSTVYIEWKDVVSLDSKFRLQAELSSGVRYDGYARPAGEPGRIKLVEDPNAGEGVELMMDRVVRVARLDEGSILDRYDGYVGFGYDYTNASDIKKLTAQAGIRARRTAYAWTLDTSVRVTDTGDEPPSKRVSFSGGIDRFMLDRWFRRYLFDLESNDELGLDLRTLVGAGLGRYLVQSNEYEWSAVGGLALSREQFQERSTKENVEVLLGTDFSWYVYDYPKTDFYAKLYVLPSLTDSGRYRAQSDLRARRELYSDLFLELNLYGVYDSKPGSDDSDDLDYGITTSLNFTF